MLWRVIRSRRPHAPVRARRRSFRPVLHCLEDRWLPSTFNWFQNVDGNFNDAARWHDQNGNNGVPGPGDDANIPNGGYTVTSSVSHIVRSLNCSARLTLTGGTFTVGDAINDSSINQLVVGSGAGFHVSAGRTFLTNGTASLGDFTVDAGAKLVFNGGTHHIDSGTALLGDGEYYLSNGTLSIDVDVNAPTNFILEGGTLTGTGTFTVTGTTMMWTGGAMSGLGGHTVIAADGSLIIDGPNRKDIRNGYNLINNGAAAWQGAGGLLSDTGATITNNGSWDARGDLSVFEVSGPDATFINSVTGVLTKSAGPGALVMDDFFSNAGTVNVTSGTFQLDNGSYNTGTIDAAPGTRLLFTRGTQTLDSGTTIPDAGLVELDNGTVVLATDLEIANFTLIGGVLNSANTLTVDNAFAWTGGTLTGLGTAVSNGTLTLEGPNRKDIRNGYSLVNNGAAVWQGAGGILSDTGAQITNNGSWDVRGDLSITEVAGPDATFTNSPSGVLTKSAGPGTLYIGDAFNNAGTVNINSGTLQLDRGGYSTGVFNAVAGTTLTFTGGTHTLAAGANLTSAGQVLVNGGTMIVDAAVSAQTFELRSGVLHLTLNGMLNVGGDYTQRVGTNLVIDIGGTAPGAGYGQLNVAGTANLAGTLTVVLTNDYSPSIGNSYQILTFGARNGDFGAKNLENLGTDRHFDPVYGTNDLTLNVVPT